MSNFICSECGMTNIDCGRAGYKTPKEIELEKKVHILNEANMKLENELGHFADLSKKVERLQEQLNEAREVVKFYAETTVGHKQKDGTYRLSVANGTINFLDPFFGMTSGMQEYVYDPRPAKKYLKKWGVK